jgi:serine/threonine protein kinase
VDPLLEQNWSGRGQHAEFKKHEQKLIDELLEVQEILGTTRTAFVQSVKCRRILLARKTIMCGKQTMTKQEAVAEVAHLTKLNHAHVLRVIGTYVKGRELSILLYPVAGGNLERFLEHYHEMRSLFIADFGIARSYAKLEGIETDGRTSFTRRYAAPKVVKQEQRGLPADIFSLGCVFVKVYDALFKRQVWYQRGAGLQACLNPNSRGETSYHANIDAIQADLSKFTILQGGCDVPSPSLMIAMLRHDAEERPSAEILVTTLGARSCCITGSIVLQAVAKETPELDLEAS